MTQVIIPYTHIKEAISNYFYKDFNYRLIHYLLEKNHDFKISFQQLKRKIIPSMGLFRRSALNYDVDDILQKAKIEIENGCNGCENLRRTLKIKYCITITRKFARDIVRELDKNGVERRKKRRLRRRQYITKGPNYVWHIDGYDKLTPYGIGIHGCIDGFSRKILWLHAGITNRRPEVVASYFVDTVEKFHGCPVKVRGDPGTENGMLAAMQMAFHNSENAFIYGTSHANQRIERWWGILRQCKADFWIDHFKTLESDGHLVRGNQIHLLCLQFVYIPLIQNHLEEVVEMWNSHTIRRQKMGDVINGIPDVLFSNPEITGAEDCLSPTTEEEIQDMRELCQNNYTELDPDFIRIVEDVTETYQIPNAAEDFATARNLFIVLSEVITKLYHQM
ncbi:hypothetical protein ACJMK2_032374 [Sinanodonta woodiana]|uniref:Integrase core domain-containing protein n=1 Tax=Sinanodonta woodiana TaxID=1069815 RepID=A0ABD3X5F8_SINWO